VLAELDPVTTTQAQLDLLEAQEELDKLQKRRTSLDYPRATDDFIKDLRKQLKAAKRAVSELTGASRSAEDPMLRSQLLASLATAKENQKSLESKLNWYTSNPTENEIIAADSELALAQAKLPALCLKREPKRVKRIRLKQHCFRSEIQRHWKSSPM
jgi:multidrug efflux pump subunit AcrA (membrane-fusion protein)